MTSAAAIVAPLAAEQRLEYADFWSGLEAFLALHVRDAARRKALSAAVDAAHYGLLRGMNLEDVAAVGAMMAAEAAAEAAGGRGARAAVDGDAAAAAIVADS